MAVAGGEDIEDALWLIKTGNSEVGPVSTDEMVAMIEAGEISARTLVKTLDGPQRWFRVDETALYSLTIPPAVRETPMSKASLSLARIVAFGGWSYCRDTSLITFKFTAEDHACALTHIFANTLRINAKRWSSLSRNVRLGGAVEWGRQ